MSALSKINGSRSSSGASGSAYGDLRDKVAALVRPDRGVLVASSPLQLRPTQEEPVTAPVVKAERFDDVGRDLGSAFDILGRATTCFDLLTQKLDQVEGERDEAMSQIEEHRRTVAGWQEMIETIQGRMRDAERDLTNVREELASQSDRAKAAEDRAIQLENLLKLRDRRLSELEKNYTSLHDQVMTSFGLQSPTYRSLEALVDRFQAKAA